MKGYVNLTHTNNSAIEKVSQKVDEIQDDYVTKDTTELTNYYTKNQTYTKEEVDNKTANVYRAKGSVQTYQDLPTTNNQVGDVYNVIEAYEDYPAGTNFVWTDTSTWDALGGEISVIQGVSQEDFDALVNNETQIVNDDNTFKAGGTRNLNVNPLYSVIIGSNADSGNFGVAIGHQATNNLSASIAIGHNSKTNADDAIQLGEGTNNIEHSLQIEDDNIYKSDTHTLTVQNAEINGTPAYGVLSGTSAPTTTTVGAVGQFYLDTTNKQLYQCMSINQTTVDNVNINEYEWKLINDNGTIVNIDNVKQSTIDFDSDPQTQINQLSNPNLLINGDFSINQRGQEEYGNSTQYSVDRWQLTTQTNANLSFNVTTKTLSNTGTSWGYFVQRIESNDVAKIWGKTWTFSAKVNGNIYSKTFTAPSTAPTSSQGIAPILVCVPNICNVRLFYYAQNGTLGSTFDINTGSVTLEYAKLELGSVATPFSPRPYAEELALCQRYYQIRSNSYTIQPNAIDRPIPMRVDGTIGTITINETTYNYVDAEIY